MGLYILLLHLGYLVL
ncbi:hypothetical protein [Chryseobacterium bernardetii]